MFLNALNLYFDFMVHSTYSGKLLLFLFYVLHLDAVYSKYQVFLPHVIYCK